MGSKVNVLIAFVALVFASSCGGDDRATQETNPYAGLVLDAEQYGTATDVEIASLEDCLEAETGFRRLEDVPGDEVGYDIARSYRDCAEELGIASKVIQWQPAEPPSDQSIDETNQELLATAECLRERGWILIELPPDSLGYVAFEFVEGAPPDGRDYDADVDDCLAAEATLDADG